MVRIDGRVFDGTAAYVVGAESADIEALIVQTLSADDVVFIQNASLLEQLAVSNGTIGEVVAEFNLVAWRSVTKVRDGIRFTWQTFRTTDMERLKQENEDLTQALLELAEIVGGNNG